MSHWSRPLILIVWRTNGDVPRTHAVPPPCCNRRSVVAMTLSPDESMNVTEVRSNTSHASGPPSAVHDGSELWRSRHVHFARHHHDMVARFN